MLILPAERALDWRRPPLVTFALILLNALIFFGYQSGDSKLEQQAVEYYLDNQLLQIELPEYKDYLQRRISLGNDPRQRLLKAIDELEKDDSLEAKVALSYILLFDQDFSEHLKLEGKRFLQDDVYRGWLEKRTHLEETWIQKISSIRFGLIPAHIGLDDLVAYQFLHGDTGHLVGNMIFLFLLGYGVEASIGRFRYLLAYLLCGACSGLFFCLINQGSVNSLVGASGSISGLMGMYVTLYGLRKIRFFFWAGVYFNYFKAPALWILPVWIGKEVYEYWRDPGSQVAYMAHAGGLAAGSALVFLLRRNWLKPEVPADTQVEEKDLDFRKAYHAALDAVSRVDFKQAKIRFQILVEKFPDNLGMQEHLYHIEKLNPASPDFVVITEKLLASSLKANQTDLALETYKDMLKRRGDAAALGESWHYRILVACLRTGNLKEAEAAFQALRESGKDKEMVRDGCQTLMRAFQQREMPSKVQFYKTVLNQIDEHMGGPDPGIFRPN